MEIFLLEIFKLSKTISLTGIFFFFLLDEHPPGLIFAYPAQNSSLSIILILIPFLKIFKWLIIHI